MTLLANLTRRSAIRAGGIATLAVGTAGALREFAVTAAAIPTTSSRLALAASTGCATLAPETTEGPFWIDEQLNRSDIRSTTKGTDATRAGVPLTLTINLIDTSASCTVQQGVYVDIWHADATGNYSDVSGSGNNSNSGKNNWLRGYQVSDSGGSVTFTTIYPGWYVSRAIHIHVRLRTTLSSSSTINFTTQLFFDESITQAVLKDSNYKADSSQRTTNSTDSIYTSATLVPLTGSNSAGYAGAITLALAYDDGSPASTTATATATTSATASATTSTSASATTSAATSATTSATTSTSATTTPSATTSTTASTSPSTTASTTTASSSPSASTSTTTASSTPTSTTSTIVADTVVNAVVTSAKVVRKGKKRVVVVALRNAERTTANVRLVRSDNVLAHRTWGWLPTGLHRLTFKVPKSVRGGTAKVSVILADSAGNAKITRVRVTVPSR
ncbi:MAG: hypothetical protein QM572_16540 [Nocardioides sp.]|uniref:dioxygenase family protein n=1 Tax=Nocardioides sp. TaxID=35761 RepID=UPI0039E3E7B9